MRSGALAEENRPFTEIHVSLTFIPNGDKYAFRALVDSGAQGSLVSARVLDSLGAAAYAKGFIVTADGSRTSTSALWLRVGVPPFPSRELRVMVMTTSPEGYDAILGMDYLIHHHFEIDRGEFRLIA